MRLLYELALDERADVSIEYGIIAALVVATVLLGLWLAGLSNWILHRRLGRVGDAG